MAEERITTVSAALADWERFEAQLRRSAAAMGVTSEVRSTTPTDNLPPFDYKVVRNLALMGLGFVAVALGVHYIVAHQTAVEAVKAVQNTGDIVFQCIQNPELAGQAGWQMVTQTVDGAKGLMQTAANSLVDLGHGFANAAGTVFQRGAGQTGFHQVYVPPGGALSLSGVIGSCPAQMVPLP